MRKQIINTSQVTKSNYIKKIFMLINFQFLIIFSLILILTPFLTSCGGGGGTGGSSNPKITRMVVFGDSLPDYGVFGHKKNIQASVATGPGSSPMFADLIATNKNLPDACNYYVGSPDNVFNAVFSAPNSSCTNYAVSGGRIIYRNASSTPSVTDPRHIPKQVTDAAINLGGYTSKDLVLIGAAGNDFSDLMGAGLNVLITSGAAQQSAISSFASFVSTIVPSAIVNSQIASIVDASTLSAALATLGTAYASGMAVALNTTIKTGILDLGAEKVIISSAAAITLTPRFLVILGAVEASAGAATRQAIESLFNDWNVAYNSTLESLNVNEPRTVFYNIYTGLQNYTSNPTAYGFDPNSATVTACPYAGIAASGPYYDLSTCTEALAAANVGPNYANYIFSDGFHPTSAVYKLVAQDMINLINEKGW